MGSDGASRRRAPRWFVFWMRLLALLVAVVGAVLFWQLGAEGAFPTIVVLWVVLGVVAGVAVLFGLFGIARYRAYLSALIVPVLLAVLGGLVWDNVPERVAWQLSHGILEDQAQACVNPGRSTRLGVYVISYVARRDGGCLFYTQTTDGDSVGFGYFPAGPPPRIGDPPPHGIGYQPFRGPWYRFADES